MVEELEENEEVIYDRWTVKGRNVPSADDFPLMHAFTIPIDNMQTIQCLLNDLIKVAVRLEEGICRKIGSFKMLNYRDNHTNLYLPIANDSSRKHNSKLNQTIKHMISHSKNANYSRDVISELEHKYADEFFNVCYENKYCTKETINMSPEFLFRWLRPVIYWSCNKRIINKYLTYHLGHRVCTSESDISTI